MMTETRLRVFTVALGFYRAMLRIARYCYGKSSVRLSVCPFVTCTLRYRDHLGWNISKMISRLVSRVCSLFADPNIIDLLHREYHQILDGTGVRVWKKVALGVHNLTV